MVAILRLDGTRLSYTCQSRACWLKKGFGMTSIGMNLYPKGIVMRPDVTPQPKSALSLANRWRAVTRRTMTLNAAIVPAELPYFPCRITFALNGESKRAKPRLPTSVFPCFVSRHCQDSCGPQLCGSSLFCRCWCVCPRQRPKDIAGMCLSRIQ